MAKVQKKSFVCNFTPNILCLVILLVHQSNLVSSRLPNYQYHVDSLVDTRKALLSYFAETAASSPSNSLLTNVEEIERAVYERQAHGSLYLQTPTRVKKIEGIIKLAAQHGNEQFLRQALGHALYTTINIQKSKLSSLTSRRKKRCAICVDAVKKMMRSIKRTIGKRNFKSFVGNENANKATLTFAVDDTGSMHQEIQAVKDIATYIVKMRRPNLEVDFILSPFNDPERGRAIKKGAGKGKEFIDQIDALYANGGGDCKEMAFTGILEALKKGPVSNSPLYVFTDAPPKDVSLLEDAKRKLYYRGVSVYFFLTKACGDEADYKPFEELAKDTCGGIFELPKSRSDIGEIKNFTRVLLEEVTCSSYSGYQLLRKKKRSVAAKEYKLMADDTMDKIIVTISSANSSPKITLRDPLGNSVEKTVGDKSVTMFEVANRKPGLWTLTVPPDAGKHTYLFKTTSKTNMDFDFIFVIPRVRGTPLPISHPLTGKYAHVVLIVREADKIQSSSLYLNILKEDGSVLRTASVRPAGTRSRAHFSATFVTPSALFKLQLRGKTKKNFDFERNSKITIQPSHVMVKAIYSGSEFTVPKHTNESVMFLVYNTDVTEMFDVSVEGTSVFNVHYQRSHLVYQDRLATIDVYFSASPLAAPGTEAGVLVTVTGRTSKTTAKTVVSLMVS